MAEYADIMGFLEWLNWLEEISNSSYPDHQTLKFYEIRDKLECLPKVVRCKDCKKWHRHTEVDRERGECRRYQTTKHETGFCDRGERKDND